MSDYTKPKPAVTTFKAVTTSVQQLCGPSEARTAITISSTGAVYISDNPAMVEGEGILLNAQTTVVELCTCHQGQWIQNALFYRAPAAGGGTFIYAIQGFEKWPSANRLS